MKLTAANLQIIMISTLNSTVSIMSQSEYVSIQPFELCPNIVTDDIKSVYN